MWLDYVYKLVVAVSKTYLISAGLNPYLFIVKCVNVASVWRVSGLYNIVRYLCMTTTDKRTEVEDLRQLLASRRAGWRAECGERERERQRERERDMGRDSEKESDREREWE